MRLLSILLMFAGSEAFAAGRLTPPDVSERTLQEGESGLPLGFGAGLHYPEVAALWATLRPIRVLSIDGQVSFTSAMGGLALHYPKQLRHDFFLQFLGGYRHNLEPHLGPKLQTGGKMLLAGGYAFVSDFTVRASVGMSIMPGLRARDRVGPELYFAVGVPL